MINGHWFPKDSANRHKATLDARDQQYHVSIVGHETLSGEIEQLNISHRLGNTAREIVLTDGSLFVTDDNDGIDLLLPKTRENTFFAWLHRQESSFKRIILASIFVLASAVTFMVWGLPWTSEKIAYALPDSVSQVLGKKSLELIDEYFLEDSQLDEATQNNIRQRFQTKLVPLHKAPFAYRIHFRHLEIDDMAIANAFALPSGDIIVTDKLVQLCQNDDEVDAVLLHEMGHVVYKHGLQATVQNSMTTVVLLAVFGQTDGIADLALSLGTAVLANQNSREHESEADDFAFQHMLAANINPKAFSAILQRIEDDARNVLGSASNNQQGGQNEQGKQKINNLFSSHPSTPSRSKKAIKYSRCFEQGLTTCE